MTAAIAETLFARSLEAEETLISAAEEFRRVTAEGADETDAFRALDAARTAYFNVSVLLLASEIRAGLASWCPDSSRTIGAQAFADALKAIAQNIEDMQAEIA